MKAIQTRYAGCHFRSRLEARYAVLFDSLGIKWDYEPEGFELPDGRRYLPDFWLHNPEKAGTGYWIEIKAAYPTADEFGRLWRLSRVSGHKGYFLVGVPCISIEQAVGVDDKEYSMLWSCEPITTCALDGGPASVMAAIDDARSARFEFGESGARA